MIPFHQRLHPAIRHGGFRQEDYWVWCGSVVKGKDSRYHMFAARWPKAYLFYHGYLAASEVVRASSDTPEGPYVFEEVVLPDRGPDFWDGRMTHNPFIIKRGEVYLLFYIGSSYPGPRPDLSEIGREGDGLVPRRPGQGMVPYPALGRRDRNRAGQHRTSLHPVRELRTRLAFRRHRRRPRSPGRSPRPLLRGEHLEHGPAYPEFTTVDIPWRLFGYKAAQTLEACLEGTMDHPQPRELNIPPAGLTVRRSTDALVVKDPNVTRALAFIRENSHRPLTIPDVAAACGLYRRVLEKRFADLLGFSPFEEIRRQQLERLKTLLLNSDQTIEEIVPQTAFASPSHLSTAFRQGVGLSPRDFRRQFKRV